MGKEKTKKMIIYLIKFIKKNLVNSWKEEWKMK